MKDNIAIAMRSGSTKRYLNAKRVFEDSPQELALFSEEAARRMLENISESLGPWRKGATLYLLEVSVNAIEIRSLGDKTVEETCSI
jgi:uncharacterized protein YcaQ